MKKVSTVFILLIGFSWTAFTQTVQIGTQQWATKNLNVAAFKNGDPIPQAKTDEEWEKAGDNHQPAWCYYDNDPKNEKTFGKLYNWYAVNDKRGLAPQGWHIPSDKEWTILTEYLGEAVNQGTDMKSKSGWYKAGNGTNSSGFSGLPGGHRYYTGSFNDLNRLGIWWSSTEDDDMVSAWYRYLHYGDGYVVRNSNYKSIGYSVRCLKD